MCKKITCAHAKSKGRPAKNQCKTERPENCLSDLSPRDKKWDDHRGKTEDVAALMSQRLVGRGWKVGHCSTLLGFANDVNLETAEHKLKLSRANFCKDKFCPVCCWRRGLRLQGKMFEALPAIEAQHPKHNWLFLTLTVRNCAVEDLRSTIKEMNAAWKRLNLREEWKDAVVGFVRSVEITRGADGSAHPHFHVLLMTKPSYFKNNFISQTRWAELWKESLRADYMPIVDVRKVKAKPGAAPEEGVRAAVVETLKYAVKFDDLTAHPAFFFGVLEQVAKLRFVASGGLLAGLFVDEKCTKKEMIQGDGEDEGGDPKAEPDVWFNWRSAARVYAQCAAPKIVDAPPLPGVCESPSENRRRAKAAKADEANRKQREFDNSPEGREAARRLFGE